ncbi:MAG TPA: cobalamin-binding protein [Candidatus Angelobacter sp.]
MRICSLLPSATEIVFALGVQDSLVGVTHECDYPPETARIPRVTSSNIPEGLSSGEIDRMVSSNLATQGTLYELNQALLEELAPDLILTQRLCDVCAVAFDKVQEVAVNLSSRPRVVNLEPHCLEDILENIRLVGTLVHASEKADRLVDSYRRRIAAIHEKTRALPIHPRVFCMEWVSPPYCGGHWMKKLVEIAGGRDDLASSGRPSCRIEWNRVLEFAPDAIVLTCCGYKLARVEEEARLLAQFDRFYELPAARNNRVYATNGSDYFSRPGPRIIESLEILAHLIHPEIFPAPQLPDAFSTVDLALLQAAH